MTVSTKSPLAIVGAGYVGLLTAVGFAAAREVRLIDTNQSLIEDLDAGRMPIYEPNLEERFALNRQRLSFYTSTPAALADRRPQLVFVAVGTPKRGITTPTVNGSDGEGANLSYVHGVVDDLLDQEGIAVVMKSTVPPGTGHEILKRAEACGSGLVYLSCPEFLQEGKAFASFDEPDRIVVGRTEPSWACRELRRLHSEVYPWLDEDTNSNRYLEMELTDAELVKHASNLHLATRISYANQIGNLCEELGADGTEVMRGVGADKRIGREFLDAGVGFGGSCFDKDIRALKSVARQKADLDLTLVDTVVAINEGQVERVIAKLRRRLGTLDGAHVALLGLAYKPETDDLRNGPAFALAELLHGEGATLSAWDPEQQALERAARNHTEGEPEALAEDRLAASAQDAMAEADAVVLVTEWPDFRQIDWCEAARSMRGSLVIDGRNHLDPDAVRAAGLEYEGTGRQSQGLRRPLPESAGGGQG